MFLGNDDEIIVNISFDKSEESKLKIPIKMYVNSAGYDLFANESITVSKWSRASVNTNIRFDIPKGFYGEIKSRSGLALRNGILAFNGTIDAGYKGFVYVIILTILIVIFIWKKVIELHRLFLENVIQFLSITVKR